MLIQFTPAELDEAARIKERYHEERTAIDEEISRTKDEEQRASLLVKRQRSVDAVIAELDALSDRIQRERFAPIRAKGAGAILDHAREQAPAILEQLHKQTARSYSDEYKGERHFLDEMIKGLGIGTVKDGKLYLSANYAMDELKSELRLHIEAVQDDREESDELFAILVETIENSDLTDSEEEADVQEVPAHIRRYRRTPLNDIKKYGIMNDKTVRNIVQDSDGFYIQEDNGQMVMHWKVEQTPNISTYMALIGKEDKFNGIQHLPTYDKQVCEAVATRYFYWHLENPNKPMLITPQEIWRTMNGKSSRDGQARPSDNQVERVRKSIGKMRLIDVHLDISEEIKEKHITWEDSRIVGGEIKDYLIDCREITFYSEKGVALRGYEVRSEPILFTYNRAKHAVIPIDYELLDTSEYVDDCKNVTEFKGYLLREILYIKKAKEDAAKNPKKKAKRNDIILLEAIYKGTGVQTPEDRVAGKEYRTEAIRQKEVRRCRADDHHNIIRLLDAWTSKKFIKGYTPINKNGEPLKARQRVYGYKIRI